MMRIKVSNCKGWMVADLEEAAMRYGVLSGGFKAGEFSALFGSEADARSFQRWVMATLFV